MSFVSNGGKFKLYTVPNGLFFQRLLSSALPSTVAKRLARHFTSSRSRVLTPVPPYQVWVFSEIFPHHHIVVCLISQIRRMLGQYQPLSTPTTFLPHPSSPYPSRIFPSMWLKRRPPPLRGNERCILSSSGFHLNA
jgi:hypothetical protein